MVDVDIPLKTTRSSPLCRRESLRSHFWGAMVFYISMRISVPSCIPVVIVKKCQVSGEPTTISFSYTHTGRSMKVGRIADEIKMEDEKMGFFAWRHHPDVIKWRF